MFSKKTSLNKYLQRCEKKHRLSFCASFVKLTLQNQSGVALITVLGIITVISILATGMFHFTYNELNYSTIEYDSVEADYLARSGIEAATKAYPEVASTFDLDNEKEVVTTLYLHRDASGNATISEEESGNCGRVDVTITKETRQKQVIINNNTTNKEYDVWFFNAKATIGDAKGKAKAYISPAVFANSKVDNADNRKYLYWVPKDGVITKNLKNETNATVFQPTSRHIEINGEQVSLYQADYAGVVSIEDSVTIRESNGNEKDVQLFTADYITTDSNTQAIYIMGSQAMVVDVPINLKRNRYVSGLYFVSDTIVFNKEITIFANDLGRWSEPILGDIFIKPETGNGIVYFNEPVYVQYGNKKQVLFEKGTVYSFTDEVQFFGYALKEKKVTADRWGGWIYEFGDTLKNTGELTPVDNPPIVEPTANSLTEIIWE